MRLGPYELLEEIGRGGGGRVHRARAPDGRPVAIKLLTARSPGAAARFLREQRMQGAFGAGEGFVPLLDAGEDAQGRPYLVLPLLEGGSLAERLTRGPLPPEEARGLGIALGRALGAAHARGVVHRDVKPSNVLFDAAGRPLLADLGLARHFTAGAPGRLESVGSRTGDFRGTPGYVAPEQLLDAKRSGPPADVFALGVLLYEALSGHMPFAGPTLVEIALQAEAGNFTPLRRVQPDAPPWLAALVERALDPDPARRFADGEALAQALEAGGAGGAGGTGKPGRQASGKPAGLATTASWSGELPGRGPGRWPLVLALVLLGLAAVLAGAILVLRGGAPEATPAPGPPDAGSGPGPASDPPSAGGGATPPRDWSGRAPGSLPAGLRAPWVAAGAPPLEVWGDDRGLLPAQATQVVPIAGADEVAIVARPRHPGSVSAGGPWVCDLQGTPRLTLDHPEAECLASSEDGRFLLTGGGGKLCVWTLPEGRLRATLRTSRPWVLSVACSPDGARAVTASTTPGPPGSRDHSLEVWDLERQEVRLRLRGFADEAGVAGLGFLPGPRVFAVGYWGGVTVWEAMSGSQLLRFDATLPGAEPAPIELATAPSAGILVTAGAPGEDTLCWWDLDQGRLRERERTPGQMWTAAMAVDAQGRLVHCDVGGHVRVRKEPGRWEELTRADSWRARLTLHETRVVLAERRVRALEQNAGPGSGSGAGPGSGSGAGAGGRTPAPAEPPAEQHLGEVLEVGLSPDGARVVSLDERELIEWDARSGAPLLRQRLREQPALGPECLAADGARAAVMTAEGLRVWTRERERWEERLMPQSPEEEALALHVSRDGDTLLQEQPLGFKRVLAGTDLAASPLLGIQGGRPIGGLALSPDGRRAVLLRDGRQEVWDPVAPNRLFERSLPLPAQGSLALSGSPLRLAHADYEGRLSVWRLDEEGQPAWLERRDRAPSALAISPDGGLVALAEHQGALLLWAPGEAQPRWELDLGRNQDVATALSFSADGRALLAGTRRGLVLRFTLER